MSTEIKAEQINKAVREMLADSFNYDQFNPVEKTIACVMAAKHLTKLSALAKENQKLLDSLDSMTKYALNMDDSDTIRGERIKEFEKENQELRAAMEVKDNALESVKEMLESDEGDSLECKCYPAYEGVGCPRCSYFIKHQRIVDKALTPTAGRDLLDKVEKMREALESIRDYDHYDTEGPIFGAIDIAKSALTQQALAKGGGSV